MPLVELTVTYASRASFLSLINNDTQQGFGVCEHAKLECRLEGRYIYIYCCVSKNGQTGAILSQNTKIFDKYC